MSNRTYAAVRWLTANEGGRKKLPLKGREYRGIAARAPNIDAWSIRLKFLGSVTRAEASFLVPQATEWLGSHFWLFEGVAKVAEVHMVPMPDQDLLEAAIAVLREREPSQAFTIAEGRLANAVRCIVDKPWPECLGEPLDWELRCELKPKR